MGGGGGGGGGRLRLFRVSFAATVMDYRVSVSIRVRFTVRVRP